MGEASEPGSRMGLSSPRRSLTSQTGLSTGWNPETREDWPRALEEALAFSAATVELSALSRSELPALLGFLAASPLSVVNLSVHGPVKGLDGDWAGLVDELAQLPAHVRRIVLHPDTLADEAISELARLGVRLLLENMDCRKSDGRTPAELARLFEVLPEAGFCLDVAHAWSVDRSLGLAHDLLDAFSERLREVHLSGIETSGQHRPTTQADLDLYADVLARCRHVPWILESPLV